MQCRCLVHLAPTSGQQHLTNSKSSGDSIQRVRNQASRARYRYVLEARLSALSVSQLGLVEQPIFSGVEERGGAEESAK